MAGTSIQDLQQKEKFTEYEQIRNYHDLEQVKKMEHMNNQIYNRIGIPQNISNPDIIELVQDISKNLPDDYPSQPEPSRPPKKKISLREKFRSGKIPKLLFYSILVFLIYIILSFPFVRNFIGNYIPAINSGPDGKVKFMGIIIYGVIFAVIFYVCGLFLQGS